MSHIPDTHSKYMMYSFDVYLHDKVSIMKLHGSLSFIALYQDQFWLKSDMEGLGQFGPIIVRPGHQISGTFALNKITNFDRKTKPCIADENYSYNLCLRKYAVEVSSCNIDLLHKQYNCTQNGLKLLFKTLIQLRDRTKTNITKTTGCLPKCVINKYVFDQKENEKVTWRKDWISSFYLSSETTTYQTSLESYSYEIQVIVCVTNRCL